MSSTKIISFLRILFGIIYLVNGLNYTFHFFEIPPTGSLQADQLHGAFVETGMFNVAKAVEAITGIMFLTNRYVPLGLVIALPVTIIINWMDIIVIGVWWSVIPGLFVLALNVGLMLAYIRYYLPFLVAKAEPGTAFPGYVVRGRDAG